ncbi:alpha/beta-Hydrolases superfamily protein [Euphorbia peplus]|nr:alpha/beta-Hydrolases superfamily protein [Euphorbia peplus]
MEEIKHSHVQVRELKLHVAEIGTGTKVVLFLHGFPEIWYTWRHQMISVAKAGYRAIAIDFRGYGDSDQPEEPEKATFMDLSDDVIALLDTLGISKVFLVGTDFGAMVVNIIAAKHPERVHAMVTLGIPFMLPGPNAVQYDQMPEGVYIRRFAEPGRAEADFARLDVKTVVRKIYIHFSGSELLAARDDQETMDLVDPSSPLPPWFTEKDLEVYASLYEKSGFHFALQVPYRKLGIDSGIRDPKVICPALLVIGEKDYVLKVPGIEDFIRSGQVKHFVPDLEVVYLEEGTHFAVEQLPEKVNDLIINFLRKHAS